MSIMNRIFCLRKTFQNMPTSVQASLAYMVCTFLQKGISILTTPIFTRLLTAEQYGYYNVFHSWLSVIKIFSTLFLAGSVYMQALVKFSHDRDQMTGAVASLGTVTTLIVTVFYFMFHRQLNALMHVDTFLMSCILITAWCELMFDLWAVQQRVELHFKALVLFTFFVTLIKPIVSIYAVLSTQHWKVEARILSSVIIDLLAYSWFFIRFLYRGKTFFHLRYWKYFLAFSLPLIPHYLTKIVLNHSDRIMIQQLVGYSEAGIYSLSHNLAWMLTLITQSLLNTISPWMFQRIKSQEYSKIPRPSYLVIILVAFVGLCLIAIAPEVVRFFAPAEYYEAIWIIPPLVASVYFTFLYSIFSNFEYYYEAKKDILFASLLGGLLNIILNYIFIKAFGYIATGYTTLFCFIFLSFTHFRSMKKILQKKQIKTSVFSPTRILSISLVFLSSAFGLMLIYQFPLLRYIILLCGIVLLIYHRIFILSLLKEVRK